MKRIIKICCIVCILVIVLFFYYRWIINPVEISEESVSYSIGYAPFAELDGFEYYNDFMKNPPSEKDEDYREIVVWSELNNKSIFCVNNIVTKIYDYNPKFEDRIMWIRNARDFCEGYSAPDNFCEKPIAGISVQLYVGDFKTEKEIYQCINEFVNSCSVKYIYGMQWLGSRSVTDKICLSDDSIKYEDD
ncbi:hypothetical protein [Eubacterium sp.]|uniref:hypothetical protein n=1 Tax=Eubacterium sp. TaxID=142586 RepID=UPI0025F170A6|nr:hypothetical protein [Eubacterium sp.]MCR5629628.1 hypothetical protein [Eubacterium sp.]